jgi:GDP-L-fucose synthase
LDNLEIQNNVISAAADFNTKKLVFLGSSCIYPKEAKYPLTEDQLLAGPLEPTNEPYALAKIAGIKLCEAYRTQKSKNFISVMPTNLFGPNDYYDRENSHVIPAMLMKVLEAKKEKRKSVKFWGTGKAYREFLYSDDLAEAILLCIEKYNERELINVGSGAEISIKDLGELVCKVASFDGAIEWDQDHPDGVMRKPLDSKKIQALGWAPKINLEEGLRSIMSEALAAVEAANLSLPRHHIGG